MTRHSHQPFPARRAAAALGALLVAVLPMWGCAGEKKPAATARKEAPVIPVTAGTVLRRTVPVQMKAVGSVEASASAAVKSMVAGELREVHFTEGQDVREGDLLFAIDPRPLEIALHEAQAALSGAQARLANAREALAGAERTLETDRKRGQAALETAQARDAEARARARRVAELLAGKLASQEESDAAQTAAVSAASELRQAQVRIEELANEEKSLELQRQQVRVAEAQVRSDEVSVEGARLQLGFCTIRAPLSGRTGSLLTNRGNLVKANDGTLLVLINRIQPINVAFSIPEQGLSQVRRLLEGGGKLPVTAIIGGEEDTPEEGTLLFVDNEVNSATGTIRLKARFANAARRLWPGQFVNVVLTLSSQPDTILAPATALQTGQSGTFVFVIGDDGTVQARPVTVDRIIGVEAVIADGLREGERVVTDGQLRLSPGAKVEVREAAAAKAAGAK